MKGTHRFSIIAIVVAFTLKASPTFLLADDPIFTDSIAPRVGVAFQTGRGDLGDFNLPIKNMISGGFADVAGPSLGDVKFYGWQSEFTIPIKGLGLGEQFADLQFVFDANWGRSSFQSEAFDIRTSATNATQSLLLDPWGTGGTFGSNGYIPLNNNMYFADHLNVWGLNTYEEQLYTFGIEKICFVQEQLLIQSTIAFLLGNTTQGQILEGQTGVVGGANGTPTIDYRYENNLKSTRYGIQVGVSVEYEVGEFWGRPVKLFANGEARYIYNDAEGDSYAEARGAVNYTGMNRSIEENWSDIGLSATAGIEIDICELTGLTAGVHAETWSIGELQTTAGEPFTIDEVDRDTVSFVIGLRHQF
ncbi:MAG: hypothetical protein AAGA96_17075 [Verrucomicrobiota bacterium]